jgi:hypothetical protein
MRAQSPLAAERWKQIEKIFVMALAHAEKHGDTGQLVTLVNLLPQQTRARVSQWAASASPIAFTTRLGTSKAYVRRKDDPSYKPFDLGRAASTPIFGITTWSGNPAGEQIARALLAKEFEEKTAKKCLQIVRRWFSENMSTMRLDSDVGYKELSELKEDISLRTHSELLEIYAKCIEEIANGDNEKTEDGNRLRTKVFSEWQRRSEEALVDEYFDWPSTEAPLGLGHMGAIASPADGMLSALGYHVGETNGRPDHIRCIILDDIFSSCLPPINGRAYMAEWSSPASASRLQKMANTLASLSRNEKRRGLVVAPIQRERDLEYLHRKYYVGKFGFAWVEAQ